MGRAPRPGARMNAGPVQARGLPLTAGQRDIWLDQLSRGDSPLYNIGGYAVLKGRPFYTSPGARD